MSSYSFDFFTAFVVTSPPVADHGYHFELDIDWEAEMYAARIDGVFVGEAELGGLPFNGIFRVDIFNANASGGDIVYWDEIVMMP